jgi:hypothetical protein
MFCCIGPVVFAALPGFFFRFNYTSMAYNMQLLFVSMPQLNSVSTQKRKREKLPFSPEADRRRGLATRQ